MLAEPKPDLSKVPTSLISVIHKELLEPHAIYFNSSTYELYDSFIYNTRANTYVCNNRDRFLILKPLTTPKYLRLKDSIIVILSFSTIRVGVIIPSDIKAPIILYNVVFIFSYHTSLISHDILREKSGAYLNGKHLLICTVDNILTWGWSGPEFSGVRNAT